MGLIAVLAMIVAGGAIATAAVAAIAIARGHRVSGAMGNPAAAERERIAASLLYAIALAGGSSSNSALREARRASAASGAIGIDVDLPSWAGRFAEIAGRGDRAWLLESAVRLVAAQTHAAPLRQYTALLDLSFALGFQTDALARLRERYPFQYVDHARDGRPRHADRAGGATPLFVRETQDPAACLRLLGVEGTPVRHAIVSAYRRFVVQNHPDRFHQASAEEQSAAAARFIETTRAYESLLAIYLD